MLLMGGIPAELGAEGDALDGVQELLSMPLSSGFMPVIIALFVIGG